MPYVQLHFLKTRTPIQTPALAYLNGFILGRNQAQVRRLQRNIYS